MIRLPPRPTRSDALVPSTTLFRSPAQRGKNADLVRAKQQEGEKILKALPRDALVIALDEHGRQHGSVEWAGELKDWMQSGRDTWLLIGGPDGNSPEVLARAAPKWGLTNLTLPPPLEHVFVHGQLSPQ